MKNQQFASVEEYVKARGGKRLIKKILIANNGIGAVKAIRSMRRFAYENLSNERAIQFVVMATPEDMRANAEYIRMADEIVDVPGGSNNNNYANVMLIVEIAERWNVDAVWAGWGHASENPLLPNSLEASSRKIKFIGPSGPPMQALGDKIGSTIIAQSAKVPCISWNGDGLTCSYKDGGIPPELYAQANVTTPEKALEVCKRIGFPVMIKASEGGGGKGIRKVLDEAGVVAAYRQVANEIPGSPIFVMRLAGNSRHLEVQLLADHYGNAIALNGRDCSVQRRHQKIIEEGPPLAAPPAVWKEMEKAAISLAKEVGYANAGTVEYLFTDKGFYFLELNPRLQVEHPVTEMITKVNLPAAQLQVAMEIPLYMIPDIRRLYGKDPYGTDVIDFDNSEQVKPNGHCIAVRITAENPDQGFQPTSGLIQEINFRSTPDVWGYFSVDSSGLVHEFADSQFGHLFANGVDREAARKNMIIALKELSIRGDIRTTVEYIVDMMGTDDFKNNNINTAWLDARISESRAGMGGVQRTHLDSGLVVTVGSVVQAFQEVSRRSELFCAMLGKGLLPPKDLVSTSLSMELIYDDTKYELTVKQSGPNTFSVMCNDAFVQAECRQLADGGYIVVIGGKSQVVYSKQETSGLRLMINGTTCICTKEYDPSKLEAEVAGKFVRRLAPEGTHLSKGEPYAEIEVMKMYMSLNVGEAGVISWNLSEGAAIKPGDVLARLELDDASAVRKATVFKGPLSTATAEAANMPTLSFKERPHVALRKATRTLEMVLWGYYAPSQIYAQALVDVKSAAADPRLPLSEFEEALAVLSGRLDGTLFKELRALAASYRESIDSAGSDATPKRFPVEEILGRLESYASSLAERDRAAFLGLVESLRTVADMYARGVAGRTVHSMLRLVHQYLNVERAYAGVSMEDAIAVLRTTHSGDLRTVYDMTRSHAAVEMKSGLLLELLEGIKQAVRVAHPAPDPAMDSVVPSAYDLNAFLPVLVEIGGLTGSMYHLVASKARQMQLDHDSPTVEARRVALQQAVAAAAGSEGTERSKAIQKFLGGATPIEDVLMSCFKSDAGDPVRMAVVCEIYVRRVYETHTLTSVEYMGQPAGGANVCKWTFMTKRSEALSNVPSHNSFVDLKSLSRAMSDVDVSQRGKDDGGISDSEGGGTGGGGGQSDVEGAHTGSIPSNVPRYGALAIVSSTAELTEQLEKLLECFPQYTKSAPRCTAGPVNVLHVVVTNPFVAAAVEPVASLAAAPLARLDSHQQLEPNAVAIEDACSKDFASLLERYSDKLGQADVRRVSIIIQCSQDSELGSIPGIFTFRNSKEFTTEDTLVRHIEPSHASNLDLFRLSNFAIRLVTTSRYHGGNIHIYKAKPSRSALQKAGLSSSAVAHSRFFVRVVSQPSELMTGGLTETEKKKYYVERMFVQALDRLDAAISAEVATAPEGKLPPAPANNHIFINVLVPDHVVEPATVGNHMKQLLLRFQEKVTRLGVTHFEMKIVCRLSIDSDEVPIRIIASNPTGYVVRIMTYVEVIENNQTIFRGVGNVGGGIKEGEEGGEWEGKAVNAPYPVSRPFEQERLVTKSRSGTLYVYDWLELLEEGVKNKWSEFARQRPQTNIGRPKDVMHAVELVVERKPGSIGAGKSGKTELWQACNLDDLHLTMVDRPAGKNDVGMVAWVVTLRTPEYPEGRQLIVIANDITFQTGSFGTREDTVFLLASKYARANGLPRIYLTANSGARIGMAEKIKKKFKAAWIDPADPTIGFKYLYLTPEDYAPMAAKGAVKCETVIDEATGEKQHKIVDIIGEEPDLGVENLQGSGTIAGETSLAYDQIFTLTLVVGRTVGIGAYLVRLGQRTVQNRLDAPIILTGYQALNTLMGNEVYASNDQLGGPMIMGPNGVSHIIVENHMDNILTALRWLSYVPRVKDSYLPVVDITGLDMVERSIDMCPKKGQTYDPRLLLAGHEDELQREWMSGFFDKGSFFETLSGWAQTVICGRARLGGIPLGVIYTENRTRNKILPADPADLSSHEKVIAQAGGVWFPDSAFKTAQAIKDINREGLPLMIFANWRGFSGGQRDMFDEVLKYGAYIVDGLVDFKQPCFVYIPPFGELRGGAWVVVDSTINSSVMEMYAAGDARGGVLEAAGAASIKFRAKDMVVAAHRLDPELKELDAKLADRLTPEARAVVIKQVSAREKKLMGVYMQLAVQFADLHDTPGRMVATGVVRKEVPWTSARSFFYWRLRRRLAEFDLRKQVMRQSASMKPLEASAIAKSWFVSMGHDEEAWEDDKKVLDWLAVEAASIKERVQEVSFATVADKMVQMVQQSPEAVLTGLLSAMSNLDHATKKKLIDRLTASI